MMDNWTDNHTALEEAEGKEIWSKLQEKQRECGDLADDDFGALGEYFMGQSIGNTERHALMNQMMIQMLGEEGEEQMHIVMGKRMSGCDANTSMPQTMMSGGMMPMMKGGVNPMMGYGWNPLVGGWGSLGASLFVVTFLVWLTVGVLAAVWLFMQIKQIKKK